MSATLLVVWGGMALLGTFGVQQVAASADLPIAEILAAVLDPGLLLPALGYFIIGYLMYGAVFLAIGSLCETLQDAQTLMSPMMLIMMVPLFLVMMAIDSPDSPIVAIASWVPLWTPFIMLARLPQDVGMFDIIGTTLARLTCLLDFRQKETAVPDRTRRFHFIRFKSGDPSGGLFHHAWR